MEQRANTCHERRSGSGRAADCWDRGILVAEGFDYEIIEKMYARHDNLGIAVTLKADGTIDKKIVGSVAEALPLDSENDWRLDG